MCVLTMHTATALTLYQEKVKYRQRHGTATARDMSAAGAAALAGPARMSILSHLNGGCLCKFLF